VTDDGAAAARWRLACAALTLLAVDPAGLGGLWLRARMGPVRDRMTGAFDAIALPRRRLHPEIGDTALFGGVDVAATLAAGHPVIARGLLAEPAMLVLAMAERAGPGLAARLGAAMDDGGGHCLIALDEAAEEGEGLAPALGERLAFRADLDGIALADAPPPDMDQAALAAARARLAAVDLPGDAAAGMAASAARLGIGSLRAPLFALNAARAAAALDGRSMVSDDDLRLAAALVLAPRATQLPAPPDDPRPEEPELPQPPEPEDGDKPDDGDQHGPHPHEDIVTEAVRAALPAGILAQFVHRGTARSGQGSTGSGDRRKGNRRGRRLPSRPGRPDGQHRIDLIATLRAAAPWQPLRRQTAVIERRVHVRSSDIRLRRFQEATDRLIVFTVDASGSAALARLAEAKGAVELMLGEAYSRRDHVALVAFRGTTAELLLPPTRSLVRTKRALTALPGGGGTPLAAGLQTALSVALTARAHGLSPAIALLTDGRANIGLDGRPGRAQAADDAHRIARIIAATRLPALVIDMSARPERALAALARDLSATYLPLPRAGAEALSAAVGATLGAR
jgi:magnesium chelatase subunit D